MADQSPPAPEKTAGLLFLIRRSIVEQMYPAAATVAACLVIWRQFVEWPGLVWPWSLEWNWQIFWGAYATLLFVVSTVRNLDSHAIAKKSMGASYDFLLIVTSAFRVVAMTVAFGSLVLVDDSKPLWLGDQPSLSVFFAALFAYVLFVLLENLDRAAPASKNDETWRPWLDGVRAVALVAFGAFAWLAFGDSWDDSPHGSASVIALALLAAYLFCASRNYSA
jgi:hypothetical protein